MCTQLASNELKVPAGEVSTTAFFKLDFSKKTRPRTRKFSSRFSFHLSSRRNLLDIWVEQESNKNFKCIIFFKSIFSKIYYRHIF